MSKRMFKIYCLSIISSLQGKSVWEQKTASNQQCHPMHVSSEVPLWLMRHNSVSQKVLVHFVDLPNSGRFAAYVYWKIFLSLLSGEFKYICTQNSEYTNHQCSWLQKFKNLVIINSQVPAGDTD